MVFRDPEAPLALAALGGLSERGRAECKGHLMGSVRGRETGQLVHVLCVADVLHSGVSVLVCCVLLVLQMSYVVE